MGKCLKGIFTAVTKISGISVKIKEMSGKKSCQGKLPKKLSEKNCIIGVLCSLFFIYFLYFNM